MRAAWERALYGDRGFYRSSWPSDHFRTSVHTSRQFAEAVLALAGRLDVPRVVDVGAGRGELLAYLHALDPRLDLVAVELRERPAGVPAAIQWRQDLPAAVDGLLLANEVVDNIPCDVVEVDGRLVPRIVEVELTTGRERLGEPASAEIRDWLDRWWPLRRPGERAEIGLAREAWWIDVVGRMRTGACLSIDYGHLAEARPVRGSLASFRAGRDVAVGYTGDRDVTAHVAFDALQDAVGGTLRRQSGWLAQLGVSAARPALELASTDPAAYVRALSRVGEAAELTAPGGLGDFWWLLTPVDGSDATAMGA